MLHAHARWASLLLSFYFSLVGMEQQAIGLVPYPWRPAQVMVPASLPVRAAPRAEMHMPSRHCGQHARLQHRDLTLP